MVSPSINFARVAALPFGPYVPNTTYLVSADGQTVQTYVVGSDGVARVNVDPVAQAQLVLRVTAPSVFFGAAQPYPLGARVVADTGQTWDIVVSGTGDYDHPLSGVGVRVAKLASGMYPVTAWPIVGDGGVHRIAERWSLPQAQRLAPWLQDITRSLDWVSAQAAVIAISRRGGGIIDFTGAWLRLIDYESLAPYPGVSLSGYGCKITSDWNPMKIWGGVYRLDGYATNPKFRWSPIASLADRSITLANVSDAAKYRVGGIYNLSNGPGGIKDNGNEPVLCQMVRITAINGAVLSTDKAISDLGYWVSPQLGDTTARQDGTGLTTPSYNMPDCDVWADSFIEGFEVFPAATASYYHTLFTGAGTYNCDIRDIISHGGAIVYGNAFCYSRFTNNTVYVKAGVGPASLGEIKIGSIGTIETGTRYLEEGNVTGIRATLVNFGEGARDCHSTGIYFDLPNCPVAIFFSSSGIRCTASGIRGRCLGGNQVAMILLSQTNKPTLSPVRAHKVSDVKVDLLGGAQGIIIDYNGNADADKLDVFSGITINALGGATVDRVFTTATCVSATIDGMTSPGRVLLNSPVMTDLSLRNLVVDRLHALYVDGVKIKNCVARAAQDASEKSPQFLSRKVYQEIVGTGTFDLLALTIPYDLAVGATDAWWEAVQFQAIGSGPVAGGATLSVGLRNDTTVLATAVVTNTTGGAQTCNWTATVQLQRFNQNTARITITVISNLGTAIAHGQVAWPRVINVVGRTLTLTAGPSAVPGTNNKSIITSAEGRYIHSAFEMCANV
ncbi:hypothetical protein PX554_18080 [Sphingomonas sp. H39-1-10]|uniref:hypothetical protein n=1 Tax=Sphingomonas pollutisoli TaxID=3030829 RepID=UPI0023B92CC3|nr:hypothetical protein [Sphingomonas pollutisoli]MDF0490046.1 hypothetical protein [Sphingomonas pollutisoli]